MPAGRILLYTASIGALALVVRSIAMGPLPILVSAIALTAYVAILLVGVFFLRLGMFVDAMSRGPEGARGVALTFDDGPSPKSTPQILDLLDEAKAKATFFVIGRKAENHPDLVREILRRGHAVAMHSYGHDRLFSLKGARYVRDDLKKACDVLQEITGDRPLLFRPPIGHTNPTIARVVKEMGLEVIGWSVRALDGVAAADPKNVAARVKRGLEDGAIVLMHDAAEREDRTPASVAALPSILAAMAARNLEGVRVDDWILEAEPAAEKRAGTPRQR
ncbi:MAG: polysaccharide deacetylase family protein [Polyangiaceae bacterium]